MVKKLFKHEILSYLRLWLPTQIILFAVALFMRLILFFESEHVVYGIVFGSSVFMYVVAIIASIGITFVFGIVRFYKNLFTREGYLTFTLPVSPMAHIFVKLFTASLFSVLTWLSIMVTGVIVTSGEMLAEIFKATGFMWNEAYKEIGFSLVFYILEFLVLLFVSSLTSYLLYYTCIAIGQMFKKNRVLAAFGVYFVYYVVNQIFSTVTTVFFAIFANQWEPIFESIGVFAEAHPHAFVHIMLLGSTVITALFGALYFFITHLIIRKKLNLE